jgi:hypothetical protein
MGGDERQLVTIRGGDDAQSSVLGVVLMMGFVAATAVSVFVVGSATVAETRDTAQEQQIESTFREFNKDVASVAYGRQKYRSMQFDIQDQTAAFRQEDTGHIEVVVDGSTIVDEDVGSLVYENDGMTIAYQAGGVWRGTGKDSRMVSRPPVEYQNGSLTFPVPALGGDDQIQAGKLSINKRKTESPVNDVGYAEGRLVTLYITSDHYMGWAQHFRSQTNDVAVSVDHSLPGDEGRVTVKLGKPVANGDFEDGVLATGGDDGDIEMSNGNPQVDGPVAATGDIDVQHPAEVTGSQSPSQESDLYELDQAIQRKINDAQTNASIVDTDLDAGGTLDDGKTYYVDSSFTLDDGESLDVDLADGNVTLVVDGDITLDGGDIDVDEAASDDAFRVYTTGNFGMKNSKAGADWSDGAKYFQVYGTSEMLVAVQGGGSTEFVGTIYAPRNEPALDPSGDGGEPNDASLTTNGKCDGWDVCITTGSSNVKGSIVAGPTKFGQNAGLTYDDELDTVEPTLQLADGVLPPPITFLKVSVHTVAVNDSGANSLQPAGGFGAPASVTMPAPATGSAAGFASSSSSGNAFVAPTARIAAPGR